MSRQKQYDLGSLTLLLVLWVFFFWRILTPIPADQLSFKQGDFSGQFLAFVGYQYDRMSQGEIPLWNPYNNGGLPFIADTQAGIFYPPRLVSLAYASVTDGFDYALLQLEAIVHILLYSWFMYAFVRRLLKDNQLASIAALVSAIVSSYGGYLSGYPPLQLALLEAGIWLPLVMLGILESTRPRNLRWKWLAFSGWMLGISWLAGHPQTSWFLTYLALAWFAYCIWQKEARWQKFILGSLVLGLITLGTTTVTLLPGIEYLLATSRSDLVFANKQNGFPYQDILQWVMPNSVSMFSPLHVGIPALVLSFVALRQGGIGRFWVIVALFGWLFSLGSNGILYELLYNTLPGLRFFRGQERAAYLFANGIGIASGIGITLLHQHLSDAQHKAIRWFQYAIIGVCYSLALIFIAGWLGMGMDFSQHVGAILLSLTIAILTLLLVQRITSLKKISWATWGLVILVGVELFTVHMGAGSNYDALPVEAQRPPSDERLIQLIETEMQNALQPFRVDGFRGLEANYGSLYHIMDIRGISPLFLTSAYNIIYQDYIHNPLAWELFAVRYVFSERNNLESTDTQVIAQGQDSQGTIYLHELTEPRPFAMLMYEAEVIDGDEFARQLANDTRFNNRQRIILDEPPKFTLPSQAPSDYGVDIVHYAPENINILVDTPENAILSLAQVDYSGWQAFINGEETAIIRAYGALSAISIPAGEHAITLIYQPLSYQIGLIITSLTWLMLIGGITILGLRQLKQMRNKGNTSYGNT